MFKYFFLFRLIWKTDKIDFVLCVHLHTKKTGFGYHTHTQYPKPKSKIVFDTQKNCVLGMGIYPNPDFCKCECMISCDVSVRISKRKFNIFM